MNAPQVGQSATIERAFTQEDLNRFAALSGDDNPIHVDPEFSAQTKFGRTVAHGMLLYSTVCGALGSQLPGPGTVQMAQELMFPSATYVEDRFAIRLEVTRVQVAKGLTELTTLVEKQDGALGLQGSTRVWLPGAVPYSVEVAADAGTGYAPSPALKGMAVGQRAETRRAFSVGDLEEYASLAGDANPVFLDAVYARRLGLARQIVPGSLLGALFSFLLGTRLPGPGTNYLKQRLSFPAPAYVDEELVATVEIVRIRPQKQLVNLSTVCTDGNGRVVCIGEALVLVSDVAEA